MHDAYDILIKPLVTEKSMILMEENKYCFMVNKKANKIEIRNAIEKLFKVKVLNVSLNKEINYSVVGSTEADPFNNKISDESPIGKVLIGAKKGDMVEYNTPKGAFKLEVLEISK